MMTISIFNFDGHIGRDGKSGTIWRHRVSDTRVCIFFDSFGAAKQSEIFHILEAAGFDRVAIVAADSQANLALNLPGCSTWLAGTTSAIASASTIEALASGPGAEEWLRMLLGATRADGASALTKIKTCQR